MHIKASYSGLIIVIDDFNVLADIINGVDVSEAEIQDFATFLESLIEAPSSGLFFSWNNKRASNRRILSRIDKGFINEEMLHLYLDIMINYLRGGICNHTPLVVRLCQHEQLMSTRFKFLNIIAADDRFIPTI